jgi:hypothetical protein
VARCSLPRVRLYVVNETDNDQDGARFVARDFGRLEICLQVPAGLLGCLVTEF